MKTTKTKPSWIIGWLVAFLGFPIGGYIASLLIGPMDTAFDGVLGGGIAGAIIGIAQFVALRRRLPVDWRWIAGTCAGLALGVGLSAALLGTATTPESILLRASLTGLLMGSVQWFVLRAFVQRAFVWIPALAVIYVVSWYLTSLVIRQSINEGFYIFGASGALLHQVLTGLVLGGLLRAPVENAQQVPSLTGTVTAHARTDPLFP